MLPSSLQNFSNAVKRIAKNDATTEHRNYCKKHFMFVHRGNIPITYSEHRGNAPINRMQIFVLPFHFQNPSFLQPAVIIRKLRVVVIGNQVPEAGHEVTEEKNNAGEAKKIVKGLGILIVLHN